MPAPEGDVIHQTYLSAEVHVRRAPWFASLSGELQDMVLHASRVRAVTAGTAVARRGEMPDQWFGVVHGALKASVCSVDGRVSSHLLAISLQWVGTEELVQCVPYHHDVIAISDCVLVVIDAPVFKRLLASSIEFCGVVLRQVSQRHGKLLERIDDARGLSKKVLVAQTVAELAHEIGGASHSAVQLKQEHIAEFVGFSRQTVNQALKKLEVEGLVCTKYSRVEVNDLQALRDFARAAQSLNV